MVLLYISIPLMVLGIAIATLPLLLTMRKEERAKRDALAAAGGTTAAWTDTRSEYPAAA